jgi:hypothetical protein
VCSDKTQSPSRSKHARHCDRCPRSRRVRRYHRAARPWPRRTQRAPSAMQLPGPEGPQDWRRAASASWAASPAKLSAVVRPPFIIGGQVDTARRLKVGGEPYDASDEGQSLGRFNLPGSNGLSPAATHCYHSGEPFSGPRRAASDRAEPCLQRSDLGWLRRQHRLSGGDNSRLCDSGAVAPRSGPGGRSTARSNPGPLRPIRGWASPWGRSEGDTRAIDDADLNKQTWFGRAANGWHTRLSARARR